MNSNHDNNGRFATGGSSGDFHSAGQMSEKHRQSHAASMTAHAKSSGIAFKPPATHKLEHQRAIAMHEHAAKLAHDVGNLGMEDTHRSMIAHHQKMYKQGGRNDGPSHGGYR